MDVTLDLQDHEARSLHALADASGTSISALITDLARNEAREFESLAHAVEAARASVREGRVHTLEAVIEHCGARRARLQAR